MGDPPNQEAYTVGTATEGSVYRSRVFAKYVVEVVEDGDVVGHTAAKVNQCGYAWRMAQTESKVFVSRHPDVRSHWEINAVVGGESVPDEGVSLRESVFEIDLSTIDKDAGVYEIYLDIGDEYGFIPSHSQHTVVIGSNPRGITEAEAIDYAAAPVADVTKRGLGTYSGGGAESIRYSTDLAYTTSPDDDTVYASRHLIFEWERGPGELVSGQSVRVRNVTTGDIVEYVLQ